MRKLLLVIIIPLPSILVAYMLLPHYLQEVELVDGARQWLQPDMHHIPKEDNSGYLLLGFDAPPGVSMWDYGVELVDRLGSEKNYDSASDTDAIKASGIDSICRMEENLCLEAYHAASPQLLSSGSNGLLLNRYQKLITYNFYQPVLPNWAEPVPGYKCLLNSQKLFHVSVIAQYENRDREAALSILDIESRFVRMLLSESNSLLMRTVAATMLARNLHVYGQLLDTQHNGVAIRAVTSLRLLTPRERDMEKEMMAEFQYAAHTLNTLEEDLNSGGWGKRLLLTIFPFKKERLLNKLYLHLSALAGLESVSPSAIPDEVQRLGKQFFPDPPYIDYLKDPVVAYMSSQWSAIMLNYSPYLLRGYEIDGLIRMLKLKAAIRDNSMVAIDIDTYITNSPYASAYPDEGARISWNKAEEALMYTPVLDSSNRFLSHLYFSYPKP